MNDFALLVDLHLRNRRQGPGGDAATARAFELAGLDRDAPLEIADIGCGTGASALWLAGNSCGKVMAVDFFREFLDVLNGRAAEAGVADRISTRCCSMENLPFEEESLDVIWSEGAIYNMGFEAGVKDWRRYLKPGGMLAVSEITWLTGIRPAEIQKHWDAEYPEIGTASSKIGVLEKCGYAPVGYFVLAEDCWAENYYGPLQKGFEGFLERNGNSEAAQAVVAAEKREIDLYEKYKGYYGYGVYVARKTDSAVIAAL